MDEKGKQKKYSFCHLAKYYTRQLSIRYVFPVVMIPHVLYVLFYVLIPCWKEMDGK